MLIYLSFLAVWTFLVSLNTLILQPEETGYPIWTCDSHILPLHNRVKYLGPDSILSCSVTLFLSLTIHKWVAYALMSNVNTCKLGKNIFFYVVCLGGFVKSSHRYGKRKKHREMTVGLWSCVSSSQKNGKTYSKLLLTSVKLWKICISDLEILFSLQFHGIKSLLFLQLLERKLSAACCHH